MKFPDISLTLIFFILFEQFTDFYFFFDTGEMDFNTYDEYEDSNRVPVLNCAERDPGMYGNRHIQEF